MKIQSIVFEAPSLQAGASLLSRVFGSLPPASMASAYVREDIADAWETAHNKDAPTTHPCKWDKTDDDSPIQWVTPTSERTVWVTPAKEGKTGPIFNVHFGVEGSLIAASQVLADVYRKGYFFFGYYTNGDEF